MAETVLKQFELQGKTALITGAAGSICGTMAEKLASIGVKVLLLDINREKAGKIVSAIRQSGGTAEFYLCSVLDENKLKEINKVIIRDYGVPDFLVNGAGGNHPDGSTSQKFFSLSEKGSDNNADFFDMEISGFKNVFNLNFYGTFIPARIFGKDMALRGKGSIVNISSMSGIVPLSKVVAYSAAKSAIINFTKWMAVYLSKSGVRVNTIAPGFIMTEQSKFLQFDQETGEINERGKDIITHTPLGRFGEPEELAGTLVWLLSQASNFVTGGVFPVDGGFSSYTI